MATASFPPRTSFPIERFVTTKYFGCILASVHFVYWGNLGTAAFGRKQINRRATTERARSLFLTMRRYSPIALACWQLRQTLLFGNFSSKRRMLSEQSNQFLNAWVFSRGGGGLTGTLY